MLRFSYKKSRVLKKICITQQSSNFKGEDLLNKIIKNTVYGETKSEKEILIEELLTLLSTDSKTLEILEHHHKKFDDLRNIIVKLELFGAGQIIKGHYVPVSSIAFLDTLNILLSYWDGENFSIKDYDNQDSNTLIASKMLQSF